MGEDDSKGEGSRAAAAIHVRPSSLFYVGHYKVQSQEIEMRQKAGRKIKSRRR